ncbi:Cerevisin [Drechslerella dactyloides]|uniref:Cerevisin n=1 Tax=Drechslerella dactyloides TaxID=74499 RepID=A0AAD6IU34_DREDA|nr:Cerevisin [Drechslerella dactyloides]
MRVSVLASSFLLVAIQAAYAAPAFDQAVRRDEIAALAHNLETLPPATIPEESTIKVAAANEDAVGEYVVVMSEGEGRAWPEIFDAMGYNVSPVNSAGFNTKAFETDDGTRIDTFGTSIRAFTMKLTASEAADMGKAEGVASLELNGMAYAAVMPDEADSGIRMPLFARAGTNNSTTGNGQIREQNTAPWNLQRVSSANPVQANGRRATDLTFNYKFDAAAGSGVDVYVLDTGINVGHVEFGGRAVMGFSGFGNVTTDDGGHGSHCSGTIGGTRFGVAKNVNLIGVKVLSGKGSGPFSAIMGGLDFAMKRHLQRANEPDFKGSVVSMSLGGKGRPTTVLNMMAKASKAGMHFSVAAGNDNSDACNFWPSGFSADLPILSVGATDINDNRASFSNFGKCVDIHAPGVAIVSSDKGAPNAISSKQGTSMACPAVSGMLADELIKNPNLKMDPVGMKQLILSKAIKGVVKGASNAPNILSNGLK